MPDDGHLQPAVKVHGRRLARILRSGAQALRRWAHSVTSEPAVGAQPATVGGLDPRHQLRQIIARSHTDTGFHALNARFEELKVENWLKSDERALHYGIGAFGQNMTRIVEIGSYKGASAAFLAGGLRHRGGGRVTCIDPHLGGPPWLGVAPWQRTIEAFRATLREIGVDQFAHAVMGDSQAVAAVWPGEQIDCVFIDADHSFLGALKDFECFMTKLRPGGLVMIDDADDPVLTELLDLVEFLKTLQCVSFVELIDGVAVFSKNDVAPWAALAELSAALAVRHVHRAWDLSRLHTLQLPSHYEKSKTWTEGLWNVPYQLAFMARCGDGNYGVTASMSVDDRRFLDAVAADRGDGEVVEVKPGETVGGFRTILCTPDEAVWCAPLLQNGGVLIARHHGEWDYEASIVWRQKLLDAGLDGCGFYEHVHWGVWRPHHLSADAVVHHATRAFTDAPRQVTAATSSRNC